MGKEKAETQIKTCYICSGDRFVDDHHIDCKEGVISPETVPMCRRCHRTYHDRGVEWFEDEYLDRILEIENRRRHIVYDNLKKPVKPLELLKKGDVIRTDYYRKTHGMIPKKVRKEKQDSRQFPLPLLSE